MNDLNTMTAASIRIRLAALKAEEALLEGVLANIERSDAAQEISERVRELTNAYAKMDPAAISESMGDLTRAWVSAWQKSVTVKS